ncbi:MAG: hypothetical protein AAB510_02585 [Patescibacteria group bacterium]
MKKLKNILIFTAIAGIFLLIFIFFVKKSPEESGNLVTTSPSGSVVPTDTNVADSTITQEFLTLLLSVEGIKLDATIFSNPAFTSLRDSTIILNPDGTEGRPNPFAPIGSDKVSTSVNISTNTQPNSSLPKNNTNPTN